MRMKRHGGARLAALVIVALAGVLVGCSGSDDDPPVTSPPSEQPSASESPSVSGSPSADPTETPTSAPVVMPDDCRAILSEAVLDQLEGVPLNYEAFGPSGVMADGSLRCIWADPAADTTSLTTDITRMARGPALDMLNALVDDEDFLCYQPDEGTRCEKNWPNADYPVTDGRTLYWRGGILIDTRYSNLAPSGYTASIVAHLFD